MVSTQRSIGIDNAKLLYDYIRGDQSNWLFFLGGETGVESPVNTIQDDNEVWNSVNFLQKVRDSDVSIVARRVNWTQGNVYYPYKASGIPAGETGEARNYYTVTDKDEVFVCLSSNEKNREDLRGLSSSTVKPTRDTDNETLSDGYRWKFLYKIDLDQIKFKTKNYIPVPDINEYDIISSSSSLKEEAFKRGCGINTGQTGACCLYHKRDAIEPITDILFSKGQLDFCFDDVLCSKCFEVAKKMDREFIFRNAGLCGTGATGCPETKDVREGYQIVLDNSKFLSPNSNTKLQSTVYDQARKNEGQLHAVFIDLSGLTEDDLTISTENPKIVLSSQSGTGAVVELTTYKKGQNHVVDGIRLVNSGSGYRDISASSADAGLQNRITFSLDYPGGLFSDPRRLLNATKVMIKVVLRADRISTDANTNQSSFTRYGLFRDVEVNNENSSYIAGSGTNRNQVEIFSNRYKLRLSPISTNFDFGSSPSFVENAGLIDVTKSTQSLTDIVTATPGTKTINTANILSYTATGGASDPAIIEAVTANPNPFTSGDSLANNSSISTTFELSKIEAEPTIKAFSGQLVSSNLTNITTSTEPKEVSFQFVYTLGSY